MVVKLLIFLLISIFIVNSLNLMLGIVCVMRDDDIWDVSFVLADKDCAWAMCILLFPSLLLYEGLKYVKTKITL